MKIDTADSQATQKLKIRDKNLQPTLVNISDNVYTAVNFTASTVSMIESSAGVVLIDAGQDPDECAEILKQFRTVTQKPILGIIYTHGHPDHTMGTPAFLEKGNNDDNKVVIWARDNFNAENKQFMHLAPIFAYRGNLQSGLNIPNEKRINNGVSPLKTPKTGGFEATTKAIPPTHTFNTDSIKITLAGIELELYSAPGETADQLFVWYPEKKILFCGDNVFRSFPNLYAVRGSGYRDVLTWAKSVEKMIPFKPNALVMGHSLPATSPEEAMDILTNYRDAIFYVYNKTIEGMNKGLTPDDLVEYAKLPPHLAEKDYLHEFYGNVEWSIRSIYNGHLGWFDGNARKLVPLTPLEEATRMADLVQGKDKLLAIAQKALDDKDYKWAAQLADYCITLGLSAKLIKASALDALGEQLLTTTGRNFILAQAEELRK